MNDKTEAARLAARYAQLRESVILEPHAYTNERRIPGSNGGYREITRREVIDASLPKRLRPALDKALRIVLAAQLRIHRKFALGALHATFAPHALRNDPRPKDERDSYSRSGGPKQSTPPAPTPPAGHARGGAR